ncbi:MAG: xanthine dehydrogenase small subunit [Pirellulales bacterium]
MRDYVLLYINGQRHAARGSAGFGSLSDFVRSTTRLTGTKVVCAEGDCGSCTVLIGRPQDGQVVYRPVTSCIQYVAQLDGAHVITVEGLGNRHALSAVQQAMVTEHGAQCGYCTPGMVVALTALFEQSAEPSRHEVCRALVGNLCRCTGYESILAAAAHMDRAQWRPLGDVYPSQQMLAELEQAKASSLEVVDGRRRAFKPATLAEAVRWRAAHPEATILAGGTDLGVAWNKGKREVASLLCLAEVPELNRCALAEGTWMIGAATTIAEVERAAIELLPAYAALLERFGSPPIKNAGTVGGNLANGSPIGDTMPALFVLDAEVELVSPRGARRVNMNQFYSGYRQTVLAADELIAAVAVPLPEANEVFTACKVSKRRDLDISTFTAALWMHLAGDSIRAARIALGGVAATILRLPRTEAWLSERTLSEETMRQAGQIAREEIAPISDVRGSAAYRTLLAENILLKMARDLLDRRVVASQGG